MSPDGARDDIARRKLGTGHVRHEAIAIFVNKDCALATHGLTDQFQRVGAGVEGGRMELDKFEIGHGRTGPRREREPLATGSGRIGPVQKQSADASGRDDDAVGGKSHRIAVGLADEARHRIVFDDQSPRAGRLAYGD